MDCKQAQAKKNKTNSYPMHSLHLTKLPWTPNKFYQFLFYLSWYYEAESTRCRPFGRWSSLTPHQRWSFQMTTCKISFTSFHLPIYVFIFYMSGLSSAVILVSRVSWLRTRPTFHWGICNLQEWLVWNISFVKASEMHRNVQNVYKWIQIYSYFLVFLC